MNQLTANTIGEKPQPVKDPHKHKNPLLQYKALVRSKYQKFLPIRIPSEVVIIQSSNHSFSNLQDICWSSLAASKPHDHKPCSIYVSTTIGMKHTCHTRCSAQKIKTNLCESPTDLKRMCMDLDLSSILMQSNFCAYSCHCSVLVLVFLN